MNAAVLIPLSAATVETGGGKASSLARLLRAGFPVPDGFVVPSAGSRGGAEGGGSVLLARAIGAELAHMGDPAVAVRSSASTEDTKSASAAGLYESILGVRGTAAVLDAVGTVRASADHARVANYQRALDGGAAEEAQIAVLVQRLVDADVAGVMFTPGSGAHGTRIEASWGLGSAVVGGEVTPDVYDIQGAGEVRARISEKSIRRDRTAGDSGIATHAVAASRRAIRTLDDEQVASLVSLGRRVADYLGGPQDIEWALEGDTTWILQARPITAPLPAMMHHGVPTDISKLRGAPGAHGTATGPARIVRGPADFSGVNAQDIIVCPYTGPAWTPLFAVAAGVVTETGGALSHAAIVAREYGIPAVLGVAGATVRIHEGDRITVDGTAGVVAVT